MKTSLEWIHLKAEMTVGDVLTLITILITLFTLYSAWRQERRLREKELANDARTACAAVLGKLERWRELSGSLFENAQPLYVETSELLAREQNVIKARDYLWKRLSLNRNGTRQSILQEKLESAYIELYGYSPRLAETFIEILAQMKSAENELFADFLDNAQNDVLGYGSHLAHYTSAMLGNDLRKTAAHFDLQFEARMREIIAPLKDRLTQLMAESDKALIRNRKTWEMA